MSIYSTHKPSAGGEGGGLYLKIQDGETVKLRIVSEPAIFESESQPDEHGNTRISTRYGWLVYNQDLKQPQILQQSARFFNSVAALAQDDEWGDPTGYDIKVTRQGTGLDTTYNVMPSANREPLSKEAIAALKAIDLIEKLSASPFAQRVAWLVDFDKNGHTLSERSSNPVQAAKKPAAAKSVDEVTLEDVEGQPVDLDDIPF